MLKITEIDSIIDMQIAINIRKPDLNPSGKRNLGF